MYKLNKTGLIKSDWFLHVKNCLNNCNLYNQRITQCVPNINQFKNIVKEGIHIEYKDLWSSDVFNNSKWYNSKMFKTNLKMETYLLKLPVSLRISLTKFRVSSHKLPKERGGYENLERSERTCHV